MSDKRSYLFFFLSLTTLSGCIGSYIVHNDTSGVQYQNLATVPPRQESLKSKVYQQEIDRLRSDHDNALQQKDKLKKETSETLNKRF